MRKLPGSRSKQERPSLSVRRACSSGSPANSSEEIPMAKAKIGYAAMLEQFGPAEVLDLCARADTAGFSGVMAADQFQPWTSKQGQASFVWEVLAVAGIRTKGDLGPGVTCPSFRMHPAIFCLLYTSDAADDLL